MIRRSWVMRAVPAAAIARAPAMAAKSSATASDRCRCAPRKLMSTAWAFWMMKIINTMRAATPTISPVRMALIRVRAGRRGDACGGGGEGGGAEPLGEGGGSVLLVVACGGVAVMALLLSGWGGPQNDWPAPLRPGAAWPSAAAYRCLFSRLHLKDKTSNSFQEYSIHFFGPESWAS